MRELQPLPNIPCSCSCIVGDGNRRFGMHRAPGKPRRERPTLVQLTDMFPTDGATTELSALVPKQALAG